MVTWTQFSIRRRVSVDRFVGGLPDAAESTVRARLVELGVDPLTFPWSDLAAPVAAEPPPLQEPAPEPQAVDTVDSVPPEPQNG